MLRTFLFRNTNRSDPVARKQPIFKYRLLKAWAPLVAILAIAFPAHAQVSYHLGVVAEGVSDYTLVDPSGNSNTDGKAEAWGFLWGTNGSNGILQSSTGFVLNGEWYDNNVWDTDLGDPDAFQGYNYDTDTQIFDKPGNALAFWFSHGDCVDKDLQYKACATSTDCGLPYNYCPANPPTTYSSACIYDYPRSADTSSTNDKHSHSYLYTAKSGYYSRWGENPLTGAWAGAATNGDDSAIFLINSCGIRFPFMKDLLVAWAGVTQVNMIMPTSSLYVPNGSALFADARQWSSRGSWLASCAVQNLSGMVRNCWDAALDAAPSFSDDSCPNLDNNHTYGGGHGLKGCGAHVTIAADASDSKAQFNRDVTWAQTQNRYNNSYGTDYWYYYYHCNYACNTYGFLK